MFFDVITCATHRGKIRKAVQQQRSHADTHGIQIITSLAKQKMGKRYYCDFCERSFADNAENRKKHLNGVQHQRQKKLHYDSFRDAATILADEMAKKPCKRFSQSGQCDFGDGCRFSHLTAADIHRLQEQVKCTNEASKGKLSLPTTPANIEVEEWLAKRQEQLAKNVDTPTPRLKPSSVIWSLPLSLQAYSKLPPSIYPPCASDFSSGSINHWG